MTMIDISVNEKGKRFIHFSYDYSIVHSINSIIVMYSSIGILVVLIFIFCMNLVHDNLLLLFTCTL